FFFFQAEDGIRDKLVTGVQTCALPISFAPAAPKTGRASLTGGSRAQRLPRSGRRGGRTRASAPPRCTRPPRRTSASRRSPATGEIGRASWRERGWSWAAADSVRGGRPP